MDSGNKNIFKKGTIALFGLLLLVNTVVSAENEGVETLNKKGLIGKALAAMGTSSMMHRYNQFFAERLPVNGVPASAEIQKLGKDAQTAVGIPVERQVPIEYIAGLDVSAIAKTNAIVTGDELADDEVAYGVKRCNMFHESVHIKYHDDSFNGVLYLGSLLGTSLATKNFIKPQGKLKLLYLPSLVAGHYVGRAIQGHFCKYRERRADIEGHYATQCHQCVTEKAEDVREAYEINSANISYAEQNTDLNEAQINIAARSKRWIENKKRYLSVEENEIIAAELKRDNKVCAFHASEK